MTPNHAIHPDLVPLAVEIGRLTPDPKNARLHNERNVDAIADSYRAHGQRKAIVVQRKADDGTEMVVRSGNGQLDAVKRLGWTHIACVVVDENDRAAIAFALRDNRTADLAEWNYEVIAEEVAAFEHDGMDFTQLGWSEEEIAPLRETTWFADAKGELADHSRDGGGDTDGDRVATIIRVSGNDAKDLEQAAEVMREKFKEPKMTLSKVLGRLSRHYVATMNHSQAVKE